jgi:chromosome segregation protein
MTLNLERLEQRHAGLLNEAARADEAVALHVADAERAVADLAAEANKLKELQSERSEVLALTADAREQLRVSEAALRQVQERMSRSAHRLETLQELEEKRAVYAPPVQKVFAAREQIGVELHGVLADRLNVDDRAEQAVETVVGDLLQSIVVASGEDARRVAAFLANDAIGRIATLVVSNASDGSPTASVVENGATTLSDVLGAPAEILSLLERLLPREMGARLVEVLPEHADPGETYVTYSGDLLVGGQLLISGRNAPGEKNSSLLAFKRELAGLGREVERLRDEVSHAEAAVERDRRVLIEREETTVDLQSLIIKVERGLLNLENHERGVKQEIERSRRHGQVVASEIEQTLGEIEETQRRITEAAANREKVESLRAEAQSELDSVSARLSDARSALDAANLELNEKRTNAATSAERRRSVQTAHRRIENEQKELHIRLAQQNFEITETEGKIANLRGSVSEIAGRIADAGAAAERERAELAEAMEAVTKARAAADDASEVLAELNRNSADARNARAAVEIREAEALTELRNIAEKCLHELNIPLAELAASHETAEGFDLGETRQKAEDVRDRREGFGAINMLAVEELGEAEERLLFLTSQRQDIVDSIASAEAALREIKERSRAKFRQAFEAINENFVEFFRELFGGGRGEMTLLESDDVLEAGIEVVAQPPGKRLQNILLLSGGEKAMTAIALVLAIFKYRPSPFCLLDEVDAPLDDANVGRFVGKIAEMSERTQFIVITHNKRTMEAARALYGVTMQEPGVSKIVSVKFE